MRKLKIVLVQYGFSQKFDKINLNFKKGRKHALVGKSGAGKSSIVRLITRLWDCKEGTITIEPGEKTETETEAAA